MIGLAWVVLGASLAALVARTAGRISIMAGSGVNPANAGMLMGLGIAKLHASCSSQVPATGKLVELGVGPAVVRQTLADAVRQALG